MMTCATCCYGDPETENWLICLMTGDDVTPRTVCEAWMPKPETLTHEYDGAPAWPVQ